MKRSAIVLGLCVVFAGPALAAPGDARLIQGTLEWPPAPSSGEPFMVVRGDDGRVYHADLAAAQRYVKGPLNAGSHIALLGLEGAKPHEIIAVALGSGDATALSLTLAQATPPTPSAAPPPPAAASAAVAPPKPPAGPTAMTPLRSEKRPPARGEDRRVVFFGRVSEVAGRNLFLKKEDGRAVVVDISKLDPSIAPRLRPGSAVTVVAVPAGNKLQATSVSVPETGPSGSTPAKPPATASAQNGWVLWRRFVSADDLESHDPRMWRAQPGTKTKAQCESEVKEYRDLEPDKRLLDPAGRGYRIEYHCLPDTVDPREAKGK